jgi:chorismate mutase/prephenate dehydratase
MERNSIMALEQLNEKMNDIDKQLGELFVQRMELSAQIAKERAAQDILIPDIAGQREARARFREQVGPELEGFAGVVYATLQDVSHSYQTIVTRKGNTLADRMAAALETTSPLFPEKATVACQGVEGAYSQLAAEKLFKEPSISYMSSFEAVFSAIANGFCRYGVLPLENSTAGSVNKIYDLMMKYNFSVVRSVRIKIDHSLLARPGVKLEDIKQIYSHEQAIAQCADFLKNHPNIHVTACENTAVAAKMVAQSDRRDIAALSSHNCAELYGLNTLAASVQDKGNNYTRFICIGKELEIFPGADRTSVMLTTPHKPGSLYRIIARINSLGINLTKLESRPLPDRDFEFMFYFDLDTPVYSPKLVQLMGDLESLCDTFRYLGSYSEIV